MTHMTPASTKVVFTKFKGYEIETRFSAVIYVCVDKGD